MRLVFASHSLFILAFFSTSSFLGSVYLLPDPLPFSLLVSSILPLLLSERILSPQRLGTIIDPADRQRCWFRSSLSPAISTAAVNIIIFLLLDPTYPLPTQKLGKLRQAGPFGRVHMHVILLGDILLVEAIDVDLLLAVAGAEQAHKVGQELVREVIDGRAGVFADGHHVAHV